MRLPTIPLISIRSDEPAYLAMNEAIMQGCPPYSCFSFAHPPLFLYLFWLGDNYILVHLVLIVIQALIMYYGYKISKNKWVPLALLFCITALNYYNFYIALASVTLLILMSYYYRKRWLGVLLTTLALLNRYFALPFIGMTILYNRRRWRYLLVFIPLGLCCLLIPNFFNMTFLYHAETKALLDTYTRLRVTLITLSVNLPVIAFAYKNKWKDKFLLGTVFVTLAFIFMQKILFSMYFSIISTLLVVALMKGLDSKSSKYIVVINALVFIVMYPNYLGIFFNPAELIINSTLPVTGQLSVHNAVILINDLEDVDNYYIDTCSYRLKADWESYWNTIFNKSHILVLWLEHDRNDSYWWWSFNQEHNYTLIDERTIASDHVRFYLYEKH